MGFGFGDHNFGFRFGGLTLWIESSDVRHGPNPSLSIQVALTRCILIQVKTSMRSLDRKSSK